MKDTEIAFISFYDEDTQQVKFCVVPRSRVRLVIDSALALPIPPDAPGDAAVQITDEDARKLGAMALLCHTKRHPELRDRLRITTEAPLEWAPLTPPSTE
ncbi:hypothetical protein [Paraburkholderia rhizosphaerae]|uniref:hypothetical protein n=1 Tax=Paraburkholderia rhizosphaerae TaxID=480658 RepID=UPI00106650D1|nr:hypothetical protein [Paraburkholderia rhizosphaerae]